MIEQRAILELFEKGGISMWPLLFLSILSLSTILERLAFWLGVVAKERQLIDRVLEAARYDWQVAQEIAKQGSRKPIGRFLYAPLRLPNANPELFRLALESAADNELAAMRRGEKVLETVIALSPLLGLLGTVVGLINSLGSIRLGDIGTNATRDVTSGIGEALISTAAGLIVAIMTLAFYRIFQGFLVSQMKMFTKSGNELELLYRQFWAEAEKNPELLLRNSPPSPEKTASDPANSADSLSGELGRLSADSESSSSGSLSGESGRLSADSESPNSGSLSLDNSSLTGETSDGSAESKPTTTNVEKQTETEQVGATETDHQPEATGNVESSTKTEE